MADFTPFATGYFLGSVETFQVTAASAVAANSLVTVGCLKGMTRQTYASGETVTAFLSGTLSHYNFELTEAAEAAVTQGTEIYLTSAGKATTSASGNTLIGCLYQAIVTGEAYADVLIFPPGPTDGTGLTTAEVNALIDAKIATHAALTAGNAEGNVHPGL